MNFLNLSLKSRLYGISGLITGDLEGIARSLEKLCLIPYHDDYTTIWHRVHDMRPKIKLPTYEVEAGSDGTGFKTGNAWDRTYVYWKFKEKVR